MLGHSFIAKLSPVTKAAFRPQNPKYPSELVTLGDHLRAKRLELGLEQKEVALLVGVSTDTIINWELNQYSPAIRFYPRIDALLGYCIVQYPKTDGERLRLYRVHRGYSIKELAEILEVDPTTIQSWELDEHRPLRRYREKLDGVWREEKP